MKGDGVLNLLIFQAFQDVRMASSLVRSTIEKPEDFNVFGLFLVSSDPSYYPKKEHIRSTNSKNSVFTVD